MSSSINKEREREKKSFRLEILHTFYIFITNFTFFIISVLDIKLAATTDFLMSDYKYLPIVLPHSETGEEFMAGEWRKEDADEIKHY